MLLNTCLLTYIYICIYNFVHAAHPKPTLKWLDAATERERRNTQSSAAITGDYTDSIQRTQQHKYAYKGQKKRELRPAYRNRQSQL